MAAAPVRERLDLLLVERGLAPTRSRAQALILAGRVRSGSERLEKPGVRYPVDIELQVREGKRFVSRAGHKLQSAFKHFQLASPSGGAMDVGASTGGFTQLLLELGYEPVIALDVGRGQLDWSLRSDPRVVVVEGQNARYLKPDQLAFRPTLAVIDVSFISLEKVLPAVSTCLDPEGEIVALIKPQFEAGRQQVGRGGIIRDPEVHRSVIERIVTFAGESALGLQGVCASALRGADGNREFFVHLAPSRPPLPDDRVRVAVDAALDSPTETQP